MRKFFLLILSLTVLSGCANKEYFDQISILENDIDTYKTEINKLKSEYEALKESIEADASKWADNYNKLLSEHESTVEKLAERDKIIENLKLDQQSNYEVFWFDYMESEALRFIREEY